MANSIVEVGILLIILIFCTPSQSVLHMCRNDTETGEVVHLYRLNEDGSDCHCRVRSLNENSIRVFFNATFIKGCQYGLYISDNSSRRYLNCNSTLSEDIIYNINDEIKLGLVNHSQSETDGLVYTMKINATGSIITVTCNTAEYFPVVTQMTSSTTSSNPTGSISTTQIPPMTDVTSDRDTMSTVPYRSTPRSEHDTSPHETDKTSTGNPVSNMSQGTTVRPDSNSTKKSYDNHKPCIKDSDDIEKIVMVAGIGCLCGIVIGIVLVPIFQCLRKKRNKAVEDSNYERPYFCSNDNHPYDHFEPRVESSRRSSEEPYVRFHNTSTK